MKLLCFKSITLIELLIAIVLFALVILAFSNILVFGRFHSTNSDKLMIVQNRVSYVLAHMESKLINALKVQVGLDQVAARIDSNFDGLLTAADSWILYQRDTAASTLSYYSNCSSSSPASCANSEVLSVGIATFNPSLPVNESTLQVDLSGRYDASLSASTDNPEVYLLNKIYMPSLSRN